MLYVYRYVVVVVRFFLLSIGVQYIYRRRFSSGSFTDPSRPIMTFKSRKLSRCGGLFRSDICDGHVYTPIAKSTAAAEDQREKWVAYSDCTRERGREGAMSKINLCSNTVQTEWFEGFIGWMYGRAMDCDECLRSLIATGYRIFSFWLIYSICGTCEFHFGRVY